MLDIVSNAMSRDDAGEGCYSSAFDVAGPRLWNNLPASLRSTDSIAQFRKQLKTYMFGDWGCVGLVTLVFRRRTQIFLLTYLLTYMLDIVSNALSHDDVGESTPLVYTLPADISQWPGWKMHC